jgi:prolyl-tRNA synthetase
VKFKDAALIGLPVRVTLAVRALARGCVEVKARRATEAAEVPVGEVAARVAALLDAGSAA